MEPLIKTYNIQDLKHIGTLAALGETLEDRTCTMIIAEALQEHLKQSDVNQKMVIVPAASFEIAEQMAVDGDVEGVLIPAAYINFHKMILEARLKTIWSFDGQIPALVVSNPHRIDNPKKIYSHPTPASYYGEQSQRYTHQPGLVKVNSNAVAYKKCLGNKWSVCYTNSSCCPPNSITQVLKESVYVNFQVRLPNIK
jgi:hypothetical protein